jgi:hypothetical protein
MAAIGLDLWNFQSSNFKRQLFVKLLDKSRFIEIIIQNNLRRIIELLIILLEIQYRP